MMNTALSEQLQLHCSAHILNLQIQHDEVTIEVDAKEIKSITKRLRDDPLFRFEQLIDLCGIDYLHYGVSEWETKTATTRGFERGVHPIAQKYPQSQWQKPRLAVVYHLLSISHNWRLRVKAFVQDSVPMIDSVVSIWNNANWYEREAFDLYGILFKGHPDLRRILTDYGFIGHPFRKDFPLVGNVEVRYDAKQKRVIYEPVDIVPRTLVPKVIRQNSKANSTIPDVPMRLEEGHHGSN